MCLAKAIALDAPQDGLRDLWLTKGAILKLLSGWPLLPPLAGNRMLKWLGGAFSEMDGKSNGTLMPPGLTLNLYVTTTDIHGYNRQLPIADPPAVNTVVNKHVFEFSRPRRRREPRQRAQPGARVCRARDVVLPRRVPGDRRSPTSSTQEARERFPTEFCRAYELAGSPVDLTFFIDGGVLDNFPFRHAVRAIPGKPAATQVDRRLLFIEPDPGDPQHGPDGVDAGIPDDDLGGPVEASAPPADRRRARRADALQPARAAGEADDRRRRRRGARGRRAVARRSSTTRRTRQVEQRRDQRRARSVSRRTSG